MVLTDRQTHTDRIDSITSTTDAGGKNITINILGPLVPGTRFRV